MSVGTILLIVLILLLAGAFPGFGISPVGFGYYPFGIVGVVLFIVVILVLAGRL